MVCLGTFPEGVTSILVSEAGFRVRNMVTTNPWSYNAVVMVRRSGGSVSEQVVSIVCVSNIPSPTIAKVLCIDWLAI